MAGWASSKRLKLKKHNRYFARPGNKIFIANAGAVRFEYPEKWIVEPGENGAICFYERTPPDHHAILQMSVWEFQGPQVDWTTLPLEPLFVQATTGPSPDPRTLLSSAPLKTVLRPGLEAVWREQLMFDHEDQKEVVCRQCLARGRNVTTLLTYDFYADEAARLEPVWTDVLTSLVLGQHISDPTTGF